MKQTNGTISFWLILMASIFLVLPSHTFSSSYIDVMEKNYSVANVPLAFVNLVKQGEWVGFYLDDHRHSKTGEQFELFPGSTKAHIQGMARSPRIGRPPVFYVSVGEGGFASDAYAGIMVVEMGSSSQVNGERVGSNRLQKNTDTIFTWPPQDDKVLDIIETNDAHPSGMAMVGDILAVPMGGFVHFYNCMDPTNPKRMKYALPLIDDWGNATGANGVAITKLPDGRFLLVTDTDKGAHFYWSYVNKKSFFERDGFGAVKKNPDGTLKEAKDIFHRAFGLGDPIDYWPEGPWVKKKNKESNVTKNHLVEQSNYLLLDKNYLQSLRLPGNEPAWPFKNEDLIDVIPQPEDSRMFQGMNFVDQIGEDGGYRIFLVGSCNSHEYTPENSTKGRDELYLLEVHDFDSENTLHLEPVAIVNKVTRSPQTGNDNYKAKNRIYWESEGVDIFGITWYLYHYDWTYPVYTTRWQANFNAGAGTYVSPSGELLFYGASHFADGFMSPSANYFQYERRGKYTENDFFKMAEYSNRYVSTDYLDTPLGTCGIRFRANALRSEYTLSEWDTLSLNGEAYMVKPWVRMFANSNYTGESVMMDWQNQLDDDDNDLQDDYDDFSLLDGDGGFDNQMSSFMWCGPPDATLTFYTEDSFLDEGFPEQTWGPFDGTGNVQQFQVPGIYDDEISSVKIVWTEPSVDYDWDHFGPGNLVEDITYPYRATYHPAPGTSSSTVSLDVAGSVMEAQINVFNKAPRLDYIILGQGKGSGLEVTLNGKWFDAVDVGTVEVTWDVPDETTKNTYETAPGIFQIQHVYDAPGLYDVEVCLFDGEERTCATDTLYIQDCTYDETTITDDSIAYLERFGRSAAIDGNMMVIGAQNKSDLFIEYGAAYVYQLNDTNEWVKVWTLFPPDDLWNPDWNGPYTHYGASVAVSGRSFVVGSPGYYTRDENDGAAWVYRWNPAIEWWERTKLIADDGGAGDWFGNSVSMDGDRVVVGAPHFGITGDKRGGAYIFDWDGSAWVQTAKLNASDGANYDRFGFSVAVKGNRIVVGSRDDDNDENDISGAGSAYIFQLNDAYGWQETAKLTGKKEINDHGTYIEYKHFGSAVATDGNRVVVGEPGDEETKVGSVYVFEWDGIVWVQVPPNYLWNGSDWVYIPPDHDWGTEDLPPTFTSLDGDRGDSFGTSVAIESNRIVVGAVHDNSDAGSAWVYDWTAGGWDMGKKLTLTIEKYDGFGKSVSISGGRIAVGADRADRGSSETENETGAVYLIEALMCREDDCIEDNLAPWVMTQDITVQLDAADTASITASDVDNGSSDNCEIESLSVSPDYFNCDNVGAITVTLMATDTDGNMNSSEAIVTVEDGVLPTAATKDVVVELDENGNAEISPNYVDNGSSDNCGIEGLSLSQTAFDCTLLGDNTVILTVMDQTGNENTAEAVVTVEDNLAPSLTIPDDIMIEAQGAQTTVDIGDAIASDNCSADISNDAPTAFAPGITLVNWTAMDVSGNSTIKIQMIRIIGYNNIISVAISKLTPFIGESKHIAKAIREIEKSLKENLWLDGIHLNEKHGHKVFDHDRKAVKHLQKLLKHPREDEDDDSDSDSDKDDNTISEAASAAIQSAIISLVEADRVITTTLYDEVAIMPVVNPDNQQIVEKDLAKALTDIQKAEAFAANGKEDKAIKYYRNAWKHIIHAKKNALKENKPHDDDDDSDSDD